MTTRTVFGNISTLVYNYENQLTTVSGATSGSFSYDGDGKWVKSVVGSTTTLFVGSHYESSGGVITRYYLAGGTRVAMRKGSATPVMGSTYPSENLTRTTLMPSIGF